MYYNSVAHELWLSKQQGNMQKKRYIPSPLASFCFENYIVIHNEIGQPMGNWLELLFHEANHHLISPIESYHQRQKD